MKNKLKAWIRKNILTPDPKDSTAIVSSMGSINKHGIIDALIEEGIEMKRETLEDVVNRYNRKSASFALSGWNVDTGLVHMRSVITGPIYGKRFDPAKNSVYVSVVQSADIRKEAAQTEVEILGEMPDVMYILQVVNMVTKMPDGTLVRNRNAQVDGSYIKITGDNPAVGAYLVNTATGAETKLDAEYIVTNDPSKLMLLIPGDQPVGAYLLKIVTQYSSGNKILKAPREAIFDQELTVV